MVCPKIKECNTMRVTKTYFKRFCSKDFNDCFIFKEKKTPQEWLKEVKNDTLRKVHMERPRKIRDAKRKS